MDAVRSPLRQADPPVRSAAALAPVPSALRYGCLDAMLLWMAGAGVIPESALSACGIDAQRLEQLHTDHAAELIELKRLSLCGDYLCRSMVARLLRPRLTEICLAAATPVELARITRALKNLPEWVWTEGAPWRGAEERPGGSVYAKRQAQREIEERRADAQRLAWNQIWDKPQPAPATAESAPEAPALVTLNRALRRRLAKLTPH